MDYWNTVRIDCLESGDDSVVLIDRITRHAVLFTDQRELLRQAVNEMADRAGMPRL